MVAVVAHDAIRKPTHPDGQMWLVVWVSPDGRAIFADSITDVVNEIIPGYADLDDTDMTKDEHLEARIGTLAHLGGNAQAVMVADEGSDGFTEVELTAMLTSKELSAGVDSWNPAVPLVLLTTSYTPFTDVAQPEGSIVWLDPTSEVGFLNSMQTLGYGELWVNRA